MSTDPTPEPPVDVEEMRAWLSRVGPQDGVLYSRWLKLGRLLDELECLRRLEAALPKCETCSRPAHYMGVCIPQAWCTEHVPDGPATAFMWADALRALEGKEDR